MAHQEKKGDVSVGDGPGGEKMDLADLGRH